jgi:hypothetical protein
MNGNAALKSILIGSKKSVSSVSIPNVTVKEV